MDHLLLIEHARAKNNSLFATANVTMKENNWVKSVYESCQRCKLQLIIKNIPQFDEALLKSLASKTLISFAHKGIFSISKIRVGANILTKTTFKNKFNIKITEPERQALKENLEMKPSKIENIKNDIFKFNSIVQNKQIKFQVSLEDFNKNNNKFQLQHEIEIYTDGSVFQAEKKAAYSVYSSNVTGLIEIGRVKGKLDSYRAEGYRVYRAIKLCNEANDLHIFTDSKSLIDCINKKLIDININPTKNELESYAQSTSGDILSAIIQLIKTRQGTVALSYVEGHSGIIGNEIANDLAKWAAINLPDYLTPTIEENKLKSLEIIDTNGIAIAQAITPYISNCKKEEYYNEWCKMKLKPENFSELKINNLNNIILKKNLIHFAIKCRTNQLPCMRTLYRRDGISDQCMLCNNCLEDIPHTMSCISEADTLNLELCTKIHNSIIKIILQNNLNLNFKWPFGKIQQINNCTTTVSTTIDGEWQKDINSSAYCIIPPSMIDIIKNQYHINDEKIIKKICKEILKFLIEI